MPDPVPERQVARAFLQESGVRINYSIIFVSDMSRSVAFYRDVVGLPLKFETEHWTEFATEGATLALHLADAPSASSESAPTAAGTARPGFEVDDLDAFHSRMLEHDVPCLQPPTEQFGTRLAQYRDPDGCVFGLSEGKES